MNNLAFNPDMIINPKTEGIKYIGSKQKILPYILSIISQLNAKTVFDGFSGSTRVSQALAKTGYQVISNDLSIFSKRFAQCYLLNKSTKTHYKEIITHLNNLNGYEGWFTENYGGYENNKSAVQKDGKKRIWQIHNTKKLDAIRDEIDKITNDEIEKSVLISSLILALDKVDSTLGHQVSYLKNWSPRSYNYLTLEIPDLNIYDIDHEVLQNDTLSITNSIESDVAYFDPPYGSSNEKMPPSRVRYNSYYHIWTSICLNDKPKLFGAANRREDSSDKVAGSLFEEFRRDENGKFIVINALEKLIKTTKANYILLSYSTQGRATSKAIKEIIADLGYSVGVVQIDYKKNVMGGMSWTNDWTMDESNKLQELIFVISKIDKKINIQNTKVKQLELDMI